MNILKIIRFYWPDMIAETTNQATEHDSRERLSHGGVELLSSGEFAGVAEGSDVVPAPEDGPDEGAVVVSGSNDAGGGREGSASEGGNGALVAAPELGLPEPFSAAFFLAAASSAAMKPGLKAASPTLARS